MSGHLEIVQSTDTVDERVLCPTTRQICPDLLAIVGNYATVGIVSGAELSSPFDTDSDHRKMQMLLTAHNAAANGLECEGSSQTGCPIGIQVSKPHVLLNIFSRK